MAAKRSNEISSPIFSGKKMRFDGKAFSLVKSPIPKSLTEEELVDLKLICSDGELMVQRHFFCRKSEVFRQMLKSGMIEAQKSEVKIENFSKEVIRDSYELLRTSFYESISIPTTDYVLPLCKILSEKSKTLLDCVRFAHQYQIEDLLYGLKLTLLLDFPKEEYFRLDSELSLDLRKALLQRWVSAVRDSAQEPEEIRTYQDPQIYLDLWDLAIENKLWDKFASAFRRSKLNPELLLVKDIRKFPGCVLFSLFANGNRDVGFQVLGSSIYNAEMKTMTLTETAKKVIQEHSDFFLEKARKLANVFPPK